MYNSIESFEGYCQRMFLRNCDEKDSFNEPRYTYDEYVKTAKEFLKRKFEERSSGR
jgi:hypothetical protein